MPLEKGSSKKTVGNNIAEMEKSGYPAKQAIAASLSSARKGKSRGSRGSKRMAKRSGGRK